MKIHRLILLAIMLIPLCPLAMTKGEASGSTQKAQQESEQYPLFDNNLAAALWGMWRHDPSQLTQKEYAQVLELCNAAFDYLNEGYQRILESYASPTDRRRYAADFSDVGLSGNMVTFARTFSNRMQNLASEGRLSEENMIKVRHMILKKREFKRLIDEIHK